MSSRGLFRVVSFEELSEISNDGCEMNMEIGKTTRLSIMNMKEEVEQIIQTTELNIKTAKEEFRQLELAIDSIDGNYECMTKIGSDCKGQLAILDKRRIDVIDISNRIKEMKQSVEMIISSYKDAAQTKCRDRKFAIMEHQLKFLRKAIALNNQRLKLCDLRENINRLRSIGLDLHSKYLDMMSEYLDMMSA
ncbi:predicted protein [Chaetoceros tenuissimus]|uniref:Uncharacterized protein n=1 Tax=Chaetoceros tenuissimus TaxID=426638 RepID=A0AAD3GZB8_9STRA|nr:predicted protein [Chaetoceros tenuissimus]